MSVIGPSQGRVSGVVIAAFDPPACANMRQNMNRTRYASPHERFSDSPAGAVVESARRLMDSSPRSRFLSIAEWNWIVPRTNVDRTERSNHQAHAAQLRESSPHRSA